MTPQDWEEIKKMMIQEAERVLLDPKLPEKMGSFMFKGYRAYKETK